MKFTRPAFFGDPGDGGVIRSSRAYRGAARKSQQTGLRRSLQVALSVLALVSACAGDLDGPADDPSGESCGSGGVNVVGMIVHDARDGAIKDSAVINVNDGTNPESPASCEATVVLVVGPTRTTLQETRPGQYEAGYSDIVAGLPPLALTPGGEHRLEIDLGSDGSVDVTGTVTLSDMAEFRVRSSTPGQVVFAWSDAGAVASTTYYVQACDRQDFVFPDNFATGYVEGATTIRFGGDSEWGYFEAGSPLYARIQAETSGSLSSAGRFTAWDWPEEPLLEY